MALGKEKNFKKINTPASAFPSPLSAPSRRFSSLLRTVPTPTERRSRPRPRRGYCCQAPRPPLQPTGRHIVLGGRFRGDTDLGFRPFLAGGCGSEAPRSDLPICDPPLVLLRLMTPPPDPLSLHLPLCIAQAMTVAADYAADSTTANPAWVPWRGGTHGCSLLPWRGGLARPQLQLSRRGGPCTGAPQARLPGRASPVVPHLIFIFYSRTCFFSHPHQQVRIRLVSLFFCAQFMQLSLCTIDSL